MRGITTIVFATVFAAGAQAHEQHHGPASEIGTVGRAQAVDRTIPVEMDDSMRFKPSRIVVKEGETVRFAIHNAGRLKHEFIIGTDAELAAHAQMMRMDPGMVHSDPNMVALDGGASRALVWRFVKPGTIAFGCLQPGHFDAGMKGTIEVQGGSHPGH